MPEEVIENSAPLRARIHPDDVIRINNSLAIARLPNGPRLEALAARLTDVSDRKRDEARIYDLAYFDPLSWQKSGDEFFRPAAGWRRPPFGASAVSRRRA